MQPGIPRYKMINAWPNFRAVNNPGRRSTASTEHIFLCRYSVCVLSLVYRSERLMNVGRSYSIPLTCAKLRFWSRVFRGPTPLFCGITHQSSDIWMIKASRPISAQHRVETSAKTTITGHSSCQFSYYTQYYSDPGGRWQPWITAFSIRAHKTPAELYNGHKPRRVLASGMGISGKKARQPSDEDRERYKFRGMRKKYR